MVLTSGCDNEKPDLWFRVSNKIIKRISPEQEFAKKSQNNPLEHNRIPWNSVGPLYRNIQTIQCTLALFRVRRLNPNSETIGGFNPSSYITE